MNKEKAIAFACMISTHTAEPIFLVKHSDDQMYVCSTPQCLVRVSCVIAVFWKGQKLWESDQ